MPSNNLIYIGGTDSNYPSSLDDAQMVDSLRRQDSGLSGVLVRQGPGLSMFQFARQGGKLFNSILNTTFRGPNGPKSNIDGFFADGIIRERALDELHANRYNLTKQQEKLREHCQDLLKYAIPESHTVDTQLVTFKILVAVVTRYPGIRCLFYPKESGKVLMTGSTFKKWWSRQHQDCGKEWFFYRDLAAHCLSESELAIMIESRCPTLLGSLELNDNWSKVPVENLLSFCSSIPEFDSEKLCAIHYLAGILELPSFWTKEITDHTHLSPFLSNLCKTILQLIQDTESSIDDDCHSDFPPWMHAARNAVDILSSATLKGFSQPGNQNVPHCSQLPDIISVLKEAKMKNVLPKASYLAQSLNLKYAEDYNEPFKEGEEGKNNSGEKTDRISIESSEGNNEALQPYSEGESNNGINIEAVKNENEPLQRIVNGGDNDFKVSLGDPTWKLLPAALKKYHLESPWQNYAMFICYGPPGDRIEHCLSYDEKPLILFQKLKDAKKNPAFMLKCMKDIHSPITIAQRNHAAHKASSVILTEMSITPATEGHHEAQSNFRAIDRKMPLPSIFVSYAVAFYPYMAKQEDEFDVVVGDTFVILSRARGWWVVQRDPTGSGLVDNEISKQGWVPVGCLLETNVPVASAIAKATAAKENLSPGIPPDTPVSKSPILPLNIISVSFPCIALMDYKKKGDEEVDLVKDDVLRVFKRYNHWSYAVKEYSGDRGWVPSWFIGKTPIDIENAFTNGNKNHSTADGVNASKVSPASSAIPLV